MSSGNRGIFRRVFDRGLWAIPWALLAAVASTSCAPPEVEAIHLGLIVQRETTEGPTTIRTVQLAVKKFNQAGGLRVDGQQRPVVLLVEDHLGRPEEATRAALRMINQQKVVGLIGPSRSVGAIPVAEVANNARIPMISPASTNVATTDGKPYAFRVTYTDPVQGSGMARFARHALDAETAAVLFDEASSYSRELALAFRAAFVQDGGRIEAFEDFVGDRWQPAIEKIAATEPDVLFLPVFEETLIPVVHRARSLGMEATLLGGDSWPVAILEPLDAFDRTFLTVPWHFSAGTGSQPSLEFFGEYEKIWGEPLTFVTPVVAYDAANLLLEALRRAGRPNPESIRRALADLAGFPGVTGSITFRGTGGDPAKQGIVIELRRGKAHYSGRLPTAQSTSSP